MVQREQPEAAVRTWDRFLGLTPGEWTWLLAGVALLSYELYAAAIPDDGVDVLTRAMRNGLPRWTAITVGMAVLMGHLTGHRWSAPPYIWVVPFVALAAALARDIFIGGHVAAWVTPVLFVGSYFLGWLLVGTP